MIPPAKKLRHSLILLQFHVEKVRELQEVFIRPADSEVLVYAPQYLAPLHRHLVFCLVAVLLLIHVRTQITFHEVA